MHSMISSRRTFVALALAGAACLPLAKAAAGPFVSERITVRTEGTGPDVILIPGLNSSPRVWASAVAAVPGYRYHFVQVRGFAGLPAGKADKSGNVAAPVAEEIARYISASGLKRPAVIGHSMGGTIGLMLAARHPDCLARLMVVDMIPYLGAMFAAPGATPAQIGAISDRIFEGMRAASATQIAKSANDTMSGMVNNAAMRPVAIKDSLDSDPEVSARAFRELIVTNLIPELNKIMVPVTVLYVQPKSAGGPPEQFDAVYKNVYAPVRNVTLKRIPDSGHFIMWDQPERFQSEVAEFLNPR
ncbi:MAG: alpha/beta hydrolase [Pseudomonadota bacterium]|nr:alpha/beta hydrolase [Pseudomonadota bacterium]